MWWRLISSCSYRLAIVICRFAKPEVIAIAAVLDKEAQSRTGAGATAIIYRMGDKCGLEENSPKISAFVHKTGRKRIWGLAERCLQDSNVASYPFASQQKQCYHLVIRSPWSLQVQWAETSKGVRVSQRHLPPCRAPSPITEATDTGLCPALGWCSTPRQNLVKLRTCLEQQTAGYKDVSSCSSPGHMPSALSQAVWADTDLTLEPTLSKVLHRHFDQGTPCWVSITQQETPARHSKHFSLLEKACG